MWYSNGRVKEVAIIFGDFFRRFKSRKIEEDAQMTLVATPKVVKIPLPLGGLKERRALRGRNRAYTNEKIGDIPLSDIYFQSRREFRESRVGARGTATLDAIRDDRSTANRSRKSREYVRIRIRESEAHTPGQGYLFFTAGLTHLLTSTGEILCSSGLIMGRLLLSHELCRR